MSLMNMDRALARDSYYASTVPASPSYPALVGAQNCDVAIVGGGLAGLSAAIELASQGLSVRLLEGQSIGFGASGRNGGQVIHGFSCDLSEIESQLGRTASRQVFDMSLEAMELIHLRCQRFNINCDWQDGFIYVATNARKARKLLQATDRMERDYDYPQRRIVQDEMQQWIASNRYVAGVHDPRSGHINPLKYTLGLARSAAQLGVQIHEHSAVTALLHGTTTTLRTSQGEVQARHVLLASNVHLQNLCAPLSARIMPVGSYIVASAPLGLERAKALIPCRAAVTDTNAVLDYFRLSADHRLLYGGRVGYGQRPPMDLKRVMHQRMAKTFPTMAHLDVDYTWGGFVDVSMNRAPDFGRLPGHSNVYYLQGFSGQGLALTGLAGKLVAQAITGDATRFDVFARLRHRPFPGGRWLRSPALFLGMAWYRLKDALA